MKRILFFLLLACTSCCRPDLSLYTEGFTAKELASYRVGAPDFRRYCPSLGQHLVLRWNLRKSCPCATHICLKVRFYNCEEENVLIPLDKPCGIYTYVLADQDYLCSGGILSYRAEVYAGELLCSCAQHHLWVELIEVEPET